VVQLDLFLELYEKLKNEHHVYCLGKSPYVLVASCRYIEGLIKVENYKTKAEISREYQVSPPSITKRYKEIIKLLNLKTNNYHGVCNFCGRKIPHRRNFICFTCERSYLKYIWRKWERANICIICGELNPLFLLHSGHHLFGSSNNSFTIPICANCHELTRPRTRQSFFLFDNWKFPKTKFTEDNSKIYVHLT